MAVLTQAFRPPQLLLRKGFICDTSLVLNAPLWHPHLDVSPFTTIDKNKHSCTVVGAVWGIQGRTFDGIDDNVNAGNPASLQLSSSLTLEAWINLTDYLAHRPIITKGFSGVAQNYLIAVLNEGAYQFEIGDNINRYIVSAASGVVTTGSWHHAVGVFNDTANTLTLYLDGAQVAQTTGVTASPYTEGGDDVRVGASTYYFFKGTIGEARIYNKALTIGEINYNRNNTMWRYR